MRLFTLILFILSAAVTYGQQVDQVYYRSVVDNIIKSSCQKSDIPIGEILHEGDFIRIKTVGKIYNINPPYKNIQFTLVEDHKDYIRVSAKGICKIHLSLPKSDIKEGKNYAILKGGNCQSVIEYEYLNEMIDKAIIYECCNKFSYN